MNILRNTFEYLSHNSVEFFHFSFSGDAFKFLFFVSQKFPQYPDLYPQVCRNLLESFKISKRKFPEKYWVFQQTSPVLYTFPLIHKYNSSNKF